MAFTPVILSSFIICGEAGKKLVVVDCTQTDPADVGGILLAADYGLMKIDTCFYTNSTSADGVQVAYDQFHTQVELTTSAGDQTIVTLIGSDSGV